MTFSVQSGSANSHFLVLNDTTIPIFYIQISDVKFKISSWNLFNIHENYFLKYNTIPHHRETKLEKIISLSRNLKKWRTGKIIPC